MEQDYRPSKDLKDAIVIKSSTTTSVGNVGGTTLVDTTLTQANDYWNEMVVLILSGNSAGQSRRISDFDAATDTITVASAFNSQIASGTKYMILSQVAVAGGGMAVTDVGVRQVLEVSVTSAANAGAVTIGTVNNQSCVIESIIIHADTAQTSALTSCPVTGGANNVVTFISAADATQANLNAADKQVAWTGVVRLAATKTIVMTLNGTGATAVDLTVIITYYSSSANGGTIT